MSRWTVVSEVVSVIIAATGFGLRWSPQTLETARILYCLNAAIFYARIFRFYSFSVRLGPKLVMIKRMVINILFTSSWKVLHDLLENSLIEIIYNNRTSSPVCLTTYLLVQFIYTSSC